MLMQYPDAVTFVSELSNQQSLHNFYVLNHRLHFCRHRRPSFLMFHFGLKTYLSEDGVLP